MHNLCAFYFATNRYTPSILRNAQNILGCFVRSRDFSYVINGFLNRLVLRSVFSLFRGLDLREKD